MIEIMIKITITKSVINYSIFLYHILSHVIMNIHIYIIIQIFILLLYSKERGKGRESKVNLERMNIE